MSEKPLWSDQDLFESAQIAHGYGYVIPLGVVQHERDDYEAELARLRSQVAELSVRAADAEEAAGVHSWTVGEQAATIARLSGANSVLSAENTGLIKSVMANELELARLRFENEEMRSILRGNLTLTDVDIDEMIMRYAPLRVQGGEQ